MRRGIRMKPRYTAVVSAQRARPELAEDLLARTSLCYAVTSRALSANYSLLVLKIIVRAIRVC